jgi:hypothetical protein
LLQRRHCAGFGLADLEQEPGPAAVHREGAREPVRMGEHPGGVCRHVGLGADVGEHEGLALEDAVQRGADGRADRAVAAVGSDQPSGPQMLGSLSAGEGDVDAVVGLVQGGQADSALDRDAERGCVPVRCQKSA